MELYCVTATLKNGTQHRRYAVSRFAASQRHAEMESLPGVESVTTEPFNVPARSCPDMTEFLNQMFGTDLASMGWLAEDNPEQEGAFARQEGGDHYSKLKIQPMQYSMANGLDACQHTIIKYVTRFRDKGGVEDLRKAKHVIDMLIELETQKD